MRWSFAMQLRALIGALAAACLLAAPAAAQGEAGTPGSDSVPTVTIINKAPGSAPAAPDLKVSPAKPDSAGTAAPAPAARESPAREAPAASAGGAEPAKPADGAGKAPQKKAEPAPLPEPTLTIDIDLTRQRMTVSEEGAKLYTWPISSARYGYRTPVGTYRPTWMAKMWYSRQYDLAPMPHAIFFHKGVAIHGTYDTGALGRPASHGCVRLARKNAATLFKLVSTHGKERTEIVVHGKPNHSGAEVAAAQPSPRGRREAERLRRGAAGYRYLPPSHYGRRYAYGPPPDYYYYPPRTRRYYAAPRRAPRGLYSDYPYGYGF
jgi:lipoprotein-anchoring transpeptidase ErfK/SrfK